VTRKRRQPQRQRLPLEIALANPAVREVEAEYSLDAPSMGDVWQCAAFAGVAAAFAFGLAHWFAVTLGIAGYAVQVGLAGLVGLLALCGYAVMLHYSRRTRQWATFDRQPGDTTKAPDFVGVADSPRTLVLDAKLTPQVTQWARQLPGSGYALAYPNWTGRGKVFSRAEYEHVRRVLKALNYETDNALTERGRMAIGRWAAGNMQARELHLLRNGSRLEDDNGSG